MTVKFSTIFIFQFFLFLNCVSSFSCKSPQPPPEADVHEPAVIIQTSDSTVVRVKVEIAQTEEQRSRGLMFRDILPPFTGMIFIFDKADYHTFWMKNTYIPLDMIFIDSELKIAGIVENAEPLSLTPRTINKKSKYVLEVRGGFCSRYGIEAGNKVYFRGFQ